MIEVVLRVDDALSADDRAWAVIDPPRRARVLLVTQDNLFLENVLQTLAVDYTTMTGDQFESASENVIATDQRSAFDVVMFDRHATDRLPRGNYLFWGAVPKIEGVLAGETIDDEIIFDWDDQLNSICQNEVEFQRSFFWRR